MDSATYEAFKNFIPKVLDEIMTLEDYEIILNRLEIPIISKTNNSWKLNTGCHNPIATDGGGNLTFYIEDRLFHCFSQCQCNYNLLTLVEQRFKTLDKPRKRINCLRWICNQVNIPFEFEAEIKHDNTTIYNWSINLNKYLCKDTKKLELEVFDESELDVCDSLYPQEWINYGISEQTMDYYGVKYYTYKSQIVLPVYDMLGQLVSIRCRNLNPNYKAKYDSWRNLSGKEFKCPTQMVLYGEYQNAFNCQRKKMVMICESEKSVLKANDWFGKDNNCVIALMGSALSNENIKKLVSWHLQKIIIAIDSDFETVGDKCYQQFENKVIKMYNQLKPYFNEIYVLYNNLGIPNAYKFSPFDYSREDFERLWASKERIEVDKE